jgi:iron(III) transport system permease protein
MRTFDRPALPRLGRGINLPQWIRPYTLITTAAIAALFLLIVFPLARMLINTFMPSGVINTTAFTELAREDWLLPVLANTLVAVGVSTVFAVAIGAVFAWLNERTDANLGIFGTVLPVLPLLMPSVALTIGWVFVAAPNVGLLNGLLVWLFGPNALQVNVYTWSGLILVYTIHGVPYAYLVVSAAIRNLDPAIEEASLVSGAGLLRTLVRVSLPAITPAIIASALLVVISGVGTYSIPAIIATTAEISVLPTQIVKLLTKDYPPRLGEAQLLGLIMLLVVVAFWLVQRRVAASGQHVTIGGRAAGNSRVSLGAWRIPARLLMGFYLAAASVVPLMSLLLVSVQRFWTPKINLAQLTLFHFEQVLFVNRVTFAAFKNSLLLSSAGATIAMTIAALTAIYAAFRSSLFSKFVDIVIKSPATIPNLVISLAFLTTLSGTPFFLSGTLTILLLAFVVMYIPPGSIAAGSAVTQVGRDLREASYIAGADEGRTIRRIVVPLALPGFAAGWTLVFVHMMGDLSASALLAGVGTPVIGFAILTIWETGSFGLLAAFSTIMCLLNALVVGLVAWLVRRLAAR